MLIDHDQHSLLLLWMWCKYHGIISNNVNMTNSLCFKRQPNSTCIAYITQYYTAHSDNCMRSKIALRMA